MTRKKKNGCFRYRFIIGPVASAINVGRYTHTISIIEFDNNTTNHLSMCERDFQHFLKVFPDLTDFFEGVIINDDGETVGYGLSYASEITSVISHEDLEIIKIEYYKNLPLKEKAMAADKRAFSYLEWFYNTSKWAINNCIRPGCYHETFWEE